ncbi:pyrroline-5-carboxylate reductase dimerization domain-containing protein [Spiroplasma litorale]
MQNKNNLEELIKEIIVPGGPTEACHNVLKDNGFAKILFNCLKSTKNKA